MWRLCSGRRQFRAIGRGGAKNCGGLVCAATGLRGGAKEENRGQANEGEKRGMGRVLKVYQTMKGHERSERRESDREKEQKRKAKRRRRQDNKSPKGQR
jgi:hypothetical protein